MDAQSSRVEFLRAVALQHGVAPSDDDLAAVLGFLDRILPELERLEAMLGPGDASGGLDGEPP